MPETAAQALANSAPAAPATPAPAAPAAAPAAANQATFWNDWADPADKDVRDWVSNKNYPDVKTLARSAQGLERLIGADRAGRVVALPADEYDAKGNLVKADVEGRKAYYAKIGVPESPDKYDIPLPAENPYPQFKTYMSQAFHEAGVPARMATQLAKGYEAAVQRMETELRAEEDTRSQAAIQELERTWGPQYKERVALAGRGKEWLAKEVGGLNDIQMRTLEGVLGTDKFMTAMWKIGAANGEPGFAGGASKTGEFGNTASEAQARLDQIMTDRAAGKINDYSWRDLSKPGGELDQLRDRVVAGMASQA